LRYLLRQNPTLKPVIDGTILAGGCSAGEGRKEAVGAAVVRADVPRDTTSAEYADRTYAIRDGKSVELSDRIAHN
jgi:hypothetical protein